MARLKAFSVTTNAFVDWIRGRVEIVEHDIPDDAHVKHTAIDPYTGNVVIALESEEFTDVPEGEKLPHFYVRVESK